MDINYPDSEGVSSSLYVSVFEGNLDMVKLLLDKGADPYSRAIHGSNVLHICAERGFTEICKEVI